MIAHPNPVELVRLDVNDSRWLDFVAARQDATPLHEPAWASFLADCYGFKAFVLALRDDERLTAGIPVLEVRSPLGSRRWVSLPFSDECSVLGERIPDLVDELERARQADGVASHEIRGSLEAGSRSERGVVHRLEITRDLDAIIRGYRSSIRQGMRIAAREGVVVRRGEIADDLTRTFYAMHVATRRRLGVPVQRRRYFALLWERLIARDKGFVLLAEREGLPLAAAVFLQSKGTLLYKYGASDATHWRLRANTALFHEAISVAIASGHHTFDWGRTDAADEGLRRFKSSWGSTETALVYTTLGARRDATRGRRAGHLARGVIRRSPESVSRLAGALLYRFAA